LQLLDLFPEEGGQKGKKHPRLIPYLPGKNYSKILNKSNRDMAEKRLPELARYARYESVHVCSLIPMCSLHNGRLGTRGLVVLLLTSYASTTTIPYVVATVNSDYTLWNKDCKGFLLKVGPELLACIGFIQIAGDDTTLCS